MIDAKPNLHRRAFLSRIGSGALTLPALARAFASEPANPSLAARSLAALPRPPTGVTPAALAAREDFWREVAQLYPRSDEVIDLEHGYWGRMADPVRARYAAAIEMVDRRGAWYARREFAADYRLAVTRIAETLDVRPEEVAITRNATEAIHNLMLQYRRLEPGDAVLYADVDYPAYKRTIIALAESRGARAVQVVLPPRASAAGMLERYREAIAATPRLRLMLLTHVSNQHGLKLPVRQIAEHARGRDVDVILDAAQSWGLVDFTLPELGADWAGFNLHKWIGAPLGLGVLYMRHGSHARVAPYPGEAEDAERAAGRRIHMGTTNFAAQLAIPAALEFHQALGGANKEARLRYLRRSWTTPASAMPHIEVLGGTDEDDWTGMGSFRLRGRASETDGAALQQRLLTEHGIFTVVRRGLDGGTCIRVTPQVFTPVDHMNRLVAALTALGR